MQPLAHCLTRLSRYADIECHLAKIDEERGKLLDKANIGLPGVYLFSGMGGGGVHQFLWADAVYLSFFCLSMKDLNNLKNNSSIEKQNMERKKKS